MASEKYFLSDQDFEQLKQEYAEQQSPFKVAFICNHNSCRSQIAEALGKHLAADTFLSYSAGTEIKAEINPDAVRLMQEIYGIYMPSSQYNKKLDAIPVPDLAIFMGCNVACPLLKVKHSENWGLDDPSGQSDTEFKRIIEQIEQFILRLKAKIGS